MDFRILGPLEVLADGQPLRLGGAKQRALLVALLVQLNRVVTAERLIELVWGDEPPETSPNVLQVYVSQLRKVLEPARRRGEPPRILTGGARGYALLVEPDRLDLQRFQRLADDGRAARLAGDPREAARLLRAALALWRGPALADITDEPFVVAERARLEELRLTALEERIEADLELGQQAQVVAELQTLVAEHPLRERLCGRLMLALYRSGRQAEASTVFHRLRNALDEAEGMEPGSALQQLLTQILNQDPRLNLAPTPIPQQQPTKHNLPLQLTSFVGREKELSELRRSLSEGRLVSLVGPAGVGKTRLALQAANGLVANHRDGVWLVELAPISDAGLAPQAIASVVTPREQPGRLPVDSLVSELRNRDVLLLLDNCEHLLESVAAAVESILRQCSGVRVLVTSRERLSLAGERIVQVRPLATTELEATLPLETLLRFDAVHLFTDRAGLVVPSFSLNATNAKTIVQICRRLEGIPLALELAAAHMNAISAEAMLDRLDDRFRLLGHSRGGTAHHRTLRAALDWSHGLLAEEEKVLFRRLSVFVGGFQLESAEAVCGFEPLAPDDVVALMARLVDKSLVTAEPGPNTQAYRLLETMREYAEQRLAEVGEVDDVRARHARRYVSLAETDRPLLRSLENAAWLARMMQEEGNLRAALEWSASVDSCTEAAELGLKLATALGPFWESRGLWMEGRQWLELFLNHLPETNAVKGQALFWAGWLAMRVSGADEAQTRAREAHSIGQQYGDDLVLAMSLLLLGYSVWFLEQWSLGEKRLEESERLFASIGDPRGLAIVLAYRAEFRRLQGDLTAANDLADRGLAFARDANMAVGSSVDTAKNLTLLQSGDVEGACARWLEGLRRPGQEVVYTACGLLGLAGAAAVQGRPHRALRLESAASSLRAKWGLHPAPIGSPLQKVFDKLLEPARQALDDDARTKAAAEGCLMSDEEAIDYALSDND